MGSPANLLEKLPPELAQALKAGSLVSLASNQTSAAGPTAGLGASSLPLGFAPIDHQLPDGGLPKGALVELSVQGAAALATSVGLSACRSAQQASDKLGGSTSWCAFIDPSGSLYAPGVAQAGVKLERLLVVRPPLEALSRVALRVVESQCFAVIVIDTVGVPGAELNVPLGKWSRIVRRLNLALEGSQSTVLLITDSAARRPLTLPVAQRIDFQRTQAHKLILQVVKDKRGRVSMPRSVVLQNESTKGSSIQNPAWPCRNGKQVVRDAS